jgi:hypothetical protein
MERSANGEGTGVEILETVKRLLKTNSSVSGLEA